jgi:two-component system, OmpR family, response regulator RegX3
MRVLLVEDDDGIAEPLARALAREGFDVERVATGRGALDAPTAEFVLLDLRLPDIDGYEVCKALRKRSETPIIMMTARSEEVDRVIGLELGADDYIVKPFGVRELVARMRAVLRRTGTQEGRTTLSVDALSIDPRTRKVTLEGSEVDLTVKEFDILALLASEAGSVFTRSQVMERVWETSWYGASKTIDVHVASLRRKLDDPGWIETVRGVGFRLRT